ncbi:MAG: hypothetical protein AAF708_10065, partial [Deinococcota bacterium]
AQVVHGVSDSADRSSLNRSLQLLNRAALELTPHLLEAEKTSPSSLATEPDDGVMTASTPLAEVRDEAATLSRIYKNIGWINLELGNLLTAEDALSTAVALDMRNAEAYCLQLELAQQSQELPASTSADDLYLRAANCLIYAEQAPVLPSLLEAARNYLRARPQNISQLASAAASLGPHRVIALQGSASAELATELGLAPARPLVQGSHLENDVVLRLESGSRLLLLCHNGQEILVFAALQVNPCGRTPAWDLAPQAVLWQLPAKGVVYAAVLYPRYGAILSNRPQVRWQAVAGALAYRVAVRYSDGELVWEKQTDVSATDLAEADLAGAVVTRAYPEDVPALLPGVRYRLEVVAVFTAANALPPNVDVDATATLPRANSTGAASTDEPNSGLGITAVSSDEVASTPSDETITASDEPVDVAETTSLQVLNFSPLLAAQQEMLEQRLNTPLPELDGAEVDSAEVDGAASSYRRALLYQQAGAYHAALAELATVSENNPEDTPTEAAELVLRAQLWLHLHQPKAARRVLDDLVASADVDVFEREIAWLEHHLERYSSTQARF